MLSGATLLQAKNSTARRWDLTQVVADGLVIDTLLLLVLLLLSCQKIEELHYLAVIIVVQYSINLTDAITIHYILGLLQ